MGAAPVQGVAVHARNAAVAPHGLRATVVDNQVTLAWNAPASMPSAGYVIEVGSEPGRSDLLTQATNSTATSFAAVAPSGTYYVRVRASGAPAGPASGRTNEIALVVEGCRAAPLPPSGLAATIAGNEVTLDWTVPVASGQVLEAGSAPGAANLAAIPLSGSQTRFTATAPAGTYYVRVRASNECGTSAASNEVTVVVAAPTAPGAPTMAAPTITGSTVALAWTPAGTGGPPTSFLVTASLAPAGAIIASITATTPSLTVTSVPRGTYYVRVRAINTVGPSPPSNEVTVAVP
jgi:predicted phage tail protein